MKKTFNIILSLLTIVLFGFNVYIRIAGISEFSKIIQFILDYGAFILLGLFTFNNLLSKVLSVFFVLFALVVIVLIILIVNPSLITNLFALIH